MALVFALYALFASVFTISKTALAYTAPYFLIGTRMAVAGVCLLLYSFWKNRNSISLSRRAWWRILILGMINIYLTNALEFYGLRYLTSFKTCFIYSLSPFLSALFSYWLLKERMNAKRWAGLTIGFLGFIPILLSQSVDEAFTGQLFFLSGAELAVMGAATFSVYGWITLRQVVNEDGVSPLIANGYSMLIGGLAALIHSLVVESWTPIPTSDPLFFLESALTLMVVSNFLAYNLYGYLLKSYTATFMSFAGFTTPLFTALFGWLFLSEQVTLPFYISGAIVFLGLFIYHQEELKKGYRVRNEVL